MPNMMYTQIAGPGFFFLGGLHAIAGFVFAIGVVLLFIWAFKHMSEKNLWKWGWIFVIVGAVVCLFLSVATFHMAVRGERGNFQGGMMIRRGDVNGTTPGIPQGGAMMRLGSSSSAK